MREQQTLFICCLFFIQILQEERYQLPVHPGHLIGHAAAQSHLPRRTLGNPGNPEIISPAVSPNVWSRDLGMTRYKNGGRGMDVQELVCCGDAS